LLYAIDVPRSEIPQEQKAEWNSLRESPMVDELLAAVGVARVLIVICGSVSTLMGVLETGQ
jgi:hypothetical protein